MGIQTFHGVVYPSHTDAMGHMTVQYYVAAFDQAMWHLVSRLGYDPLWRESRSEGWADVRYEIDFKAELRVGDLYTVESAVVDVGKSSLKSQHKLLGRDGTAAELLMTSVYFDLKERKSIPIPQSVRDGVRGLLESSEIGQAIAPPSGA
ncbi:acyl-CoA thioesterase [Paraburkholderia caribensis]|uniref:Thioesterase n=1 Tax=Paraburkholderia caribensis TaxID=75105 RepID=A0A9Q6WPC3_9BURK|nr:acyl-CoA thioesterase [Paraburkholderia caribensis]MCO4878240.1 acyl-CoA thioesterase [Paraburkholderia caribensis]PTB28655.1 acyl-CoA thioesterase [Paraburkholderia caribensis]QLB66047.1 thioesterase [Paraburkholderia caribensis]